MTEYLKFQKSNCKNCYKCIRHCPVKSIRFSGNQANVIGDECILCGKCYVVCPQNAKTIADETEITQVLLSGEAPVIASIAPSFAAYFEGCGISALRSALKKLGFADAEETAIGATFVKREYEELADAGDMDIIITSCCHTVNLLVEKYYPQLAGFLAPVATPMKAHCDDIRRRNPQAKTVFIGPCLSKKDEADCDGIDAALTFDELSTMLEENNIKIEKSPDTLDESRARLFPVNGGILQTMTRKSPDYTYLSVDGVENCKNVLNDLARGTVHRCFIEMSACEGSCSGGPIMEKHKNMPLSSYRAITDYAGEKDFSVQQPKSAFLSAEYAAAVPQRNMPTDNEIRDILRKMGKFKPSDELNCGTCGYDTCREKAIAVYQGKAEITMCLPHLLDSSERFSNNILDNTPNGILVVNDMYEVQQINKAAMKMLRVAFASDVVGFPVIRILNPSVFIDVNDNNKQIKDRRDYYAEFDKYLELTITKDSFSGNLIAIFRDVTDEEREKQEKEQLRCETLETTDKVIDKQMRVVQEIASLLGETAAETKIALTKLKESISHEDSE